MSIILITPSHLAAQNNKPKNDAGYVKGGISLILGGARTSETLTVFPALTVAPGWRFLKAKQFSLSLESPISLGVCFNENKLFFGFELPATVNMNFGYGASSSSSAGFGWSIGVGKSYHFSYNEYTFYYDDEVNDLLSLWGTVIQTTFYFSNKTRSDGFGIRIHWTSNFSEKPVRKDAFGIGIIGFIE